MRRVLAADRQLACVNADAHSTSTCVDRFGAGLHANGVREAALQWQWSACRNGERRAAGAAPPGRAMALVGSLVAGSAALWWFERSRLGVARVAARFTLRRSASAAR